MRAGVGLSLTVVADAGFGVVGVAVQAHPHPVGAVGRGREMEERFLVRPSVEDAALFERREAEGGEVGPRAALFRGLPLGAGFGCRRAVVDLDGQLEGAGVGGGEDDGAGVGGRATAPAEGHRSSPT
jgi:hypothetical protein